MKRCFLSDLHKDVDKVVLLPKTAPSRQSTQGSGNAEKGWLNQLME